MKMCPMLTAQAPNFEYTECKGGQCAWWVDDENDFLGGHCGVRGPIPSRDC